MTIDAISNIRLAQLSVYNWGSFSGLHQAPIDAQGTLITGDNGSGKSTLVDGLMALLLPAGKATFNVAAAQGDRSDRSLLSYVRGSYGTAHDGTRTQAQHKRTGNTKSALQAHYVTNTNDVITLTALMWINTPSMSLADLKRLYIVTQRPLALDELLNDFDSNDLRNLKQQFKQDKTVLYCNDNFSDYQLVYRKILKMDNPNAPALLARALGLKKIDDLTRLIRELVLEPSQVQADARQAVTEFQDLVATHEELVKAKEQLHALQDLPTYAADLEKRLNIAQFCQNCLTSLPAWFAKQCLTLWQQRLEQLNQQLIQANAILADYKNALEDAKAQVERCHANYIQAGGDRIQSLKQQLQQKQKGLDQTNQTASRYQTLARQLGLSDQLQRHVFDAQQTQLAQLQAEQNKQKISLQDNFAQIAGQLANYQTEQRELAQEIAEIKQSPDSNIANNFQRLRDELQQNLAFEAKTLMFIGELIAVKEEESVWQGAIERALGGLRTTLLVPESQYSAVTRYVNQRHLGLHLRLQAVGEMSSKSAEFKTDGFLRKLHWQTHPYRDWLKQHLARFDLQCVADTEALDQSPFSITQTGLIHFEQGRFEKKDRHAIHDRKDWQIGFSNKTRLALLTTREKELTQQLTQTDHAAKQARNEMDAATARENDWKTFSQFTWDSIDVPRHEQAVQQLKIELETLTQQQGVLANAEAQWDAAKQQAEVLDGQWLQQKLICSDLENRQRETETQLQQTEKRAAACPVLTDKETSFLSKQLGKFHEANLAQALVRENEIRASIEAKINHFELYKQKQTKRIELIMDRFRNKWEMIASEWSNDIRDLQNYLNYYQHLKTEDLPSLLEQFRERLNRHSQQSLANIRAHLDAELDEIEQRIELINNVLIRTEFKPNTYLRLRWKKERYAHVDAFQKELKQVLSANHEFDDELRFKQLQALIETLAKATQGSSAQNLESLRLLDPRYQLSFFAEEVERDTGKVRDILDSSSGKSGGEKESFAGIIVAASLAYVLTPTDATHSYYCTVFLDEAFSNTAEAVSRRVLRVFQELHLHINLITPYKNLNLARESARSLLIASRNAEQHESRLAVVTWQELDQQQANVVKMQPVRRSLPERIST